MFNVGLADEGYALQLISFLQAILDSFFLPLLQFQSAHRILRKLLAFISPQISLNHNLETLRGYVEPYSRVEDVQGNYEQSSNSDGRRRLKQSQDQTASPIALHQIEEIIL